MTKCQPKAFVVYKGYPTRWNDVDWLSIKFSSETGMDFTNFSAQFKIGDYTFTNDNLFEDWIINLTNEQTGTLPLGINTASLIVYDTLGEGKPFITNIPVLVKDWVDGEVEVDTYKATIFATLDNKNEFIVNVETAKVNLDWVEGKISEHNQSESAHQYIQNLISEEGIIRKNADDALDEKIDGVDSKFLRYRTASEQNVIDGNQDIRISQKQNQLNGNQIIAVNSGISSGKVSAYDSHITNTIIHVTSQDKENWNDKQDSLNETQLEAVNSGITSGDVGQITTNKNAISLETTNRQNADNNLQSQIDAISASSDVTDIVGTYAELQAYDTSKLKDNDIVKVLQDESQNGETTYYRWNIHTETFSLIGEEGPYYTKSDADSIFVPQTRTVNGKALSNNISLNATDVGAATSAQGAKADTALQPSALNGYATEVWVGQQGYITSAGIFYYGE